MTWRSREGWAWGNGTKMHWKTGNGASLCNQVAHLDVPLEAWESPYLVNCCSICLRAKQKRDVKEKTRQ
jgi:hypothetical protein